MLKGGTRENKPLSYQGVAKQSMVGLSSSARLSASRLFEGKRFGMKNRVLYLRAYLLPQSLLNRNGGGITKLPMPLKRMAYSASLTEEHER